MPANPTPIIIAKRYQAMGTSTVGGMSEVTHCQDLHLDRSVMLKRLLAQTEKQRLKDEQKALLKLRSKHVVQLLDLVTIDILGNPELCLVLEFIEGDDLTLGSYAPNLEYLKAIWQISSGISDIHEAGIIHRDIKPQNVRKDHMGVLKIFDFGLAREIGKDDATNCIIGTPGYMAPELFSAEKISFSPAIDVFAFGATALALLTTTPPVELQQGIQIPISKLTALMPTFHPEIPSAIGRCTDPDFNARPRMSEIRDILERHLLKDRHHARIAGGKKPLDLNAHHRSSEIKSEVGNMIIFYDGFAFTVSSFEGEVFINNLVPKLHQKMLPACVITLGGPHRTNRAFLTFDVSHPEVLA